MGGIGMEQAGKPVGSGQTRVKEKNPHKCPSVFQLDQFMSGQQHWNKIIEKRNGQNTKAIGALIKKELKIYMHTHVWTAVFNVQHSFDGFNRQQLISVP